MKRKKLVIISHTNHYKEHDGTIKGWGATVNEVNYLANHWEQLVHIGCLHSKRPPKSSLAYNSQNIRFVPIPPYGGVGLLDKLMIITKIPFVFRQVLREIKDASEVQLRIPTSMAVFLLPFFSVFVSRKFTFWVKYAGNWNQENPPLGYAIQRWWLKKNFAKCKVTINGFWENQPKHCISFENPCLTTEDIEKGIEISRVKTFEPPFVFSFVGRLEDAKGVSRIIEALKTIPQEKIKKVHFVGDGNMTEEYKNKVVSFGEKVVFHDFQPTEKVHQILAESDFFLLPSTASEGFPKVIAEAACYGTIPIVSNVSSIKHYLNSDNSFLWELESSISYVEVFKNAMESSMATKEYISRNIVQLAPLFSFENYFNKLERCVLNE